MVEDVVTQQTDPLELTRFQQLSAALTGHDVAQVLARRRLQQMAEAGYGPQIARMLELYPAIGEATDPVQAIQEQILQDPELGPAARALIVLWYIGAFQKPDGTPAQPDLQFPDRESYLEGLVWHTARAHPMGLSGGYFGYWHYAPED